ncbi:MAG TPA: hypothetical protein VEX13_03075, partial [Chloroflexia bacterium]|nr:hypothetical protein [Chloroflexia bacterium]
LARAEIKTPTPKSNLHRVFSLGCVTLPVLLLVVGCVWFYVTLLQPRFFAATETLQVTQPVCGMWQAMSGSIFGPKLPRIYELAAIAENDVWGIGSVTTVHHWNGSEWTEVSLPQSSSGSDIDLYGITALPGGEIWLAGSYQDTHGADQTLTYRLANKQWVLERSPNVGQASELRSVSGTSANDAWAVGTYTKGDQSYALALHWDGNQWSQIAVSNECPGDQYFADVLAIATNDVWAVGECFQGTSTGSFTEDSRTEVQHWDGLNWKVVPSANHKPGKFVNSNSLDAISGTSSNDIWATGNYWESDGRGYHTQPMLQHWDGKAWSEVQFTHPGTNTTSNFSDVVAFSSDNVWAVGFYARSWLRPFGVHWDGKGWRELPIPNPLAEGYYTTMSALGPNNIWATGFGFDSEDGAYHGLLARFEGSSCPAPSNP